MVFVVGVRRREVLGEVALASEGRMLASVVWEVMSCGIVESEETGSARLNLWPHLGSYCI